eukprot:3866860-Rhodomonas_salina.1
MLLRPSELAACEARAAGRLLRRSLVPGGGARATGTIVAQQTPAAHRLTCPPHPYPGSRVESTRVPGVATLGQFYVQTNSRITSLGLRVGAEVMLRLCA